MIFSHKHKPLLLCEVVHQLPGRIRIRCRALSYLTREKEEISKQICALNGITSTSVSNITANILICYNSKQYYHKEILEIAENIISSYSIIAYKKERKKHNQLTVNERRLQEEPITNMLLRVGLTTGFLVANLFFPRKSQMYFWQRFTTNSAILSAALALPIFKSGIYSLRKSRRPNADTLTATAILTSLLAGRDISALIIIWLADMAELLTAYTMDRTRKAISDMLSVGEKYTWRITKNGKEKVPLESLETGDRIVIYTGSKISVDGIVEQGEALVDQASITGEFLPMQKSKGDKVFAGTVIKTGHLVVKAEKVGDQTAVARIVHLVEEASYHKAPIQVFADRFSAQFIPLNFALAIIVFFVTRSTTRALNMLIIDYSCGVRLSTATAFSAAIYAATRHGILVKGGSYIELLADTDTLILDKTGTLTEGKPQVTKIVACQDITPRQLVEIAAAAEETSTHPMATAILDKIRSCGWKINPHGENIVHIARGMETSIDNHIIRVGSKRFMEENSVDVSKLQAQALELTSSSQNIVYIAKDKKFLGLLGVQDTLRGNMKKALNRLRSSGVDDLILLTGDIEQQARIIADRMAMDRYEAEALPEDKAETILHLQSKGVRVVMVGDGVNDAPALAYADVGIAMGKGQTDIAMEAADITITNDDPLMIPAIIHLARLNKRIVKQNFAAAIGINSVGLILASMGLLPVIWAAVLHNASTVAVVLNSGRLLFYDATKGR